MRTKFKTIIDDRLRALGHEDVLQDIENGRGKILFHTVKWGNKGDPIPDEAKPVVKERGKEVIVTEHIKNFVVQQSYWTRKASPLQVGNLTISFIQSQNDVRKWIFAGIFRVKDAEKGSFGAQTTFQHYTFEKVSGLDDLEGSLVVILGDRETVGLSFIRNIDKAIDRLYIHWPSQVKKEREFPRSPREIILTHRNLEKLDESWKENLSKLKGIYLIMIKDKLYVGRADGEDGFWERWQTYQQCPTGGDEDTGNQGLFEFEAKIGKEEFEKYWIITILQTCEAEDADKLEDLWKNKLRTREYGLNRN